MVLTNLPISLFSHLIYLSLVVEEGKSNFLTKKKTARKKLSLPGEDWSLERYEEEKIEISIL